MPKIAAPDINNAASPNSSGPKSRDVMGAASIETPKATADPAVKATTLSAKVAVPFLSLLGGDSALSEGPFSMIFRCAKIGVEMI